MIRGQCGGQYCCGKQGSAGGRGFALLPCLPEPCQARYLLGLSFLKVPGLLPAQLGGGPWCMGRDKVRW